VWFLILSCFSGLCSEWVLVAKLCVFFWGQTRFQWFMFRVGFNGQIRFMCFMFRVSLGGLYFSGLYLAFQVETWVDLRWCALSDLCELNAVYYGTIDYVSKIIISCFLFDYMKVCQTQRYFCAFGM